MNSVTISGYDDISEEAWDEVKVENSKDSSENEIFHYRINILWWYLTNLTISGTNVLSILDQGCRNSFDDAI